MSSLIDYWEGGSGDWAIPVYFYLHPKHKAQFQKHSEELLPYFSQHLSDYFEWDIALGAVKYNDDEGTHSAPSVLNVSLHLPKAGLGGLSLKATATNMIFLVTLARRILSYGMLLKLRFNLNL